MARFCTKCGKELGPNGKCSTCVTENPIVSIAKKVKRFFAIVAHRMGLGGATEEETANLLERGKLIVPDVISSNEDEVPIKQYRIAKLYSRILGKYAEGRLQITNKRVIFRTPGISFKGKQVLQYEFKVEDLAGLEIKKTNKISFINLILALALVRLVVPVFDHPFSAIYDRSTIVAIALGLVTTVALVAPFFLIKQRFWLKLFCVSAAGGVMSGITTLSDKAFDYLVGNSLFGLTDAVLTVVVFICAFNVILVCQTTDLRFCFKTNGGGDVIQIRKRILGLFLKQHAEHTDFGEVAPWVDTDLAIKEVGAILDDLHTMGDLAIDKWKE